MIIRLSETDVNVLKSYYFGEGEYSIKLLPTESDFIFPDDGNLKIRIFKKNSAYFIEMPREIKPAYTGHTVDFIPGEEMSSPNKIHGIFI